MIENPPFVRQKLDEEERDDVVKIRLNKDEREELEHWKRICDCARDSTAFKFALLWALGELKARVKGKFRVKIIRKKH